MRITVDARMLDRSGIGRYLRCLVPRVAAEAPELRFRLLGDPRALATLEWTAPAPPELVECRAPVHSVAEQVELVRRTPRDTEILWTPDYPVPVAYRGRLLVTVQDLCHLALPGLLRPHQRAYARAMFAYVRRRAAAVLVPSRATRSELERRVGAPRGPVHVVPHGVDASWGVPAGERPEAGPYLLYVGNVKPHKNLRTLVRSFAALAGRIPHRLVVVGQREGLITGDAAVVEEAERLGERVRFTGHVPDEELRRYYAHADALVLPSLYEGFGLTPLEAMAAGCPVVASDATSIPEVCGDAALYFDARHPEQVTAQLLRLLSHPRLADRLRSRGRARVRRFTWERAAREVAAVLRGLRTR